MTRSPNNNPASPPGPRRTMLGTTAALATFTAANELGVSEAAVDEAMARSAWGSVQERLTREFEGDYRGYFPKCGMGVFDEAVIATVFDALADLTGDPRRAMRTGERSDG